MTGPSARPSARVVLLISAYTVLLLAAVATIPLRIPEILQMAASRGFESVSMPDWIALTPESAPLNYFVQLPFLLVLGYSRWGVRLDSLLFAIGSCYLFVRLAKRIRLHDTWIALLLFMLLPFHLQLATAGLPAEQGLFLLLAATECFLRLTEKPSLSITALYALLLTLCIYTDRYAFLPAIGYLLFLFRFVHGAEQRRAMWMALGATVLPPLLFLPYYLWANPQVNAYWPFQPSSGVDETIESLRWLAGNEWIAIALSILLLAGVIAGCWRTFRAATPVPKRTSLFCLCGGVVSTVGVLLIADLWFGESFTPHQILPAAPAAVLLSIAAIQRPILRPVAAAVLILLAAAGSSFPLLDRSEDVQAETQLVEQELGPNSCVVFVSERFAKILFEIFAPDLKKRECLNFFHKRVVLAIHPYVRSDQQENAESFFRGLSFVETKRIREGRGEIVVMQQAGP